MESNKKERVYKNFPVEVDGNTYWISRSCAVTAFIYARNSEDELCVLANKRGKGCPNEVGKWSCPCGYVDYDDELGSIAASREVFEETGVKIHSCALNLVGVNFSKINNRNITLRYCFLGNTDVDELEKQFTTEYSEPYEVDDIKFIPLSDIDKYDWAFNHEKIIPEIAEIALENNTNNIIRETITEE